MSNLIIMEVFGGENISELLKNAFKLASDGKTVKFYCNEVTIHVDATSDLSRLLRDFHIAMKLNIPKIGPVSLEKVPQEIKNALAAADIAAEADAQAKQLADRAKKLADIAKQLADIAKTKFAA